MSDKNKAVMLSLEPRNELVFEGPFNLGVRKTLVIRNPIKNQKVAFKLKTTTPRMFSVRPNVGVLGPEQKIDIEIHMQPNVPETGKKQHKFLIQAALAIGDVDDLQEFWKVQTPDNIWDTKIKCVIAPYKASDDNLRQAGGRAGGNGAGEADFDPQEAFEKVAKLVKEVKMVKDNRLALEKAARRRREARNLDRSKHRGRDLFKFACCVLTIVAAILGAYYGKYYL